MSLPHHPHPHHHQQQHPLPSTLFATSQHPSYLVSSSSSIAAAAAAAASAPLMFAGGPQRSMVVFGTLTYRRATLVISLVSTVFAMLICCHEVLIEGGFDVRNYVAIAFCFVWIIVTALLLMGAYLKTPFLLLPWIILIVSFTPIFIVGLVIGCKMIDNCLRLNLPDMCLHEYHLFGTLDHAVAGAKMALLVIILFVNIVSVVIVCQYYRRLIHRESAEPDQETPPMDKCEQQIKYKKFRNETDVETRLPLCENMDDVNRDSTNT